LQHRAVVKCQRNIDKEYHIQLETSNNYSTINGSCRKMTENSMTDVN